MIQTWKLKKKQKLNQNLSKKKKFIEMLKKNQEAISKSPDVLECVPASLCPIKIDVREVYFIHQALYSKFEKKKNNKSSHRKVIVKQC